MEIQMMAEGFSLEGLTAIGTSISADAVANPAGGLLGPSHTTTATMMTADTNIWLN